MDEDVKHIIRKKRGAPRTVFAKQVAGDETQPETKSTDSANQKLSDMEKDNEFFDEIGSDKEVKKTTPPPPPPSADKIVTEATIIDDGDVKNKNVTDPLLAEDVILKPYAGGLTDTSTLPKGEIPEAKFEMPKNIVSNTPPAQTQQIPKAEPIQPLNKDAETLTPAEKRRGAELTVEGFWSGYDKLNQLLGFWLQTSEATRVEMHNKKELDLTMMVKVSVDGSQITVNQFYDQLNTDIKETFTVDPKLKERLFEPMCREAEKMGLVMTDRQFILKELGQDIITKLMQFMSIRGNLKAFTRSMKEEFAKQQKRNEEAEAKRVAHEERMARMIDPDTEDGQRAIYDYHMKLREVEIARHQKAEMEERVRREAERIATIQQPVEKVESTVVPPVVKQNGVVEPVPTVETHPAVKTESTEIQVGAEEVKDDNKE